MNRLVLAASFALLFTSLGAGCDDDGDSKPTDSKPGDASDAGDASGDGTAARCVGTFAALTRAQLGGATSSSGKCSAPKDLDYICTADLATKARSCGTTCLATGATPAALPGCVSACIQGQDLTAGCAECYRDLFSCTVAKCTACTADPNSAACLSCQVQQGCLPTFFQCTGLPGGSLAPDAGADAPVDRGPDTTPEVGSETSSETGAEAPDGGVDAADASAG